MTLYSRLSGDLSGRKNGKAGNVQAQAMIKPSERGVE